MRVNDWRDRGENGRLIDGLWDDQLLRRRLPIRVCNDGSSVHPKYYRDRQHYNCYCDHPPIDNVWGLSPEVEGKSGKPRPKSDAASGNRRYRHIHNIISLFVGNENYPLSRSVNPLPGDMGATNCSRGVLARPGKHGLFYFVARAKVTERVTLEFDTALPPSLWDGNHFDDPVLRHTGRHLLKFFL
jgi:hypothetical protein